MFQLKKFCNFSSRIVKISQIAAILSVFSSILHGWVVKSHTTHNEHTCFVVEIFQYHPCRILKDLIDFYRYLCEHHQLYIRGLINAFCSIISRFGIPMAFEQYFNTLNIGLVWFIIIPNTLSYIKQLQNYNGVFTIFAAPIRHRNLRIRLCCFK